MSSRSARPPGWRILIAGAGAPSLCLALALGRTAGPAVSVVVLDPGLGRARRDGRAFALSAGVLRMFDRLGLAARLAAHLQPIAAMTITDGRLADRIRPAYLGFAGEPGAPLGAMVEAPVLTRALEEACREVGVGFEALSVEAVTPGGAALELATSDGDERRVDLLVAADGARSRLRELAGIGWVGRPFGQTGIVATVRHPSDHGGRAIQHFLPAGPFAILPLRPDRDGAFRSSLVWTEEAAEARRILVLPAADQEAEMRQRFGGVFGEPDLVSGLASHPLGSGLARSWRASRFALLGDAAHEIHPLAGQGLNLGLADAAALAEQVVVAIRLGLDPGRDAVLAAYERDRRPHAAALAAATHGLNSLFSNDALAVRALRDVGLGLVDRSRAAKGFFAAQAGGATTRAPRLMRGEAL